MGPVTATDPAELLAAWDSRYGVAPFTPDDHLEAWRSDPAELIEAFLDLTARPGWHRRAACRSQGVDRWFPERGDPVAPALTLCRTCPVRVDCLDTALALPERDTPGIWGGTTGAQRRHARRHHLTADQLLTHLDDTAAA